MIDPGAEVFFGITFREAALIAAPFVVALAMRRLARAGSAFLRRPLYFSGWTIAIGGVMMAISGAKTTPATGQDVLFIAAGLLLAVYGRSKALSAPDRPGQDHRLDTNNKQNSDGRV